MGHRRARLGRRATPVPYTHLDVYKRQVDDAVDAYFVNGTVPDKAGIRCE